MKRFHTHPKAPEAPKSPKAQSCNQVKAQNATSKQK